MLPRRLAVCSVLGRLLVFGSGWLIAAKGAALLCFAAAADAASAASVAQRGRRGSWEREPDVLIKRGSAHGRDNACVRLSFQ